LLIATIHNNTMVIIIYLGIQIVSKLQFEPLQGGSFPGGKEAGT
jgi:hypothetical protein